MDRKKWLRAQLLQAGYSQRELAVELQVNEGTVSRILRGEYPIRSVRSKRTAKRVLELVSEKTGLSMDELQAETAATAAA